jgi:TatD DNase family protein
MYTDSHTHLYLNAFSVDRKDMVKRAIDVGVSRMFLPNIDSSTISAMFELADQFPEYCFPMMGLHPTSVKKDYRDELEKVEEWLDHEGIVAIGETGIDLYWDKTFQKEQEEVFKIQISWAKERELPLVVHARDSFNEIFSVLREVGTNGLSGVFHSFSGDQKDLQTALDFGFMIGINGIVTFKNSNLAELVAHIPHERILLETDAPFLAPVPYRGKRNESSYLLEVANKVGEIYNLSREEVGEITTRNAMQLFRFESSKKS